MTLDMTPLYHSLVEQFHTQLVKNYELVKGMQEANDAELAKLEERLEDASKNLGETEISDALIAKAEFLTKIGDKVSYYVLGSRSRIKAAKSPIHGVCEW